MECYKFPVAICPQECASSFLESVNGKKGDSEFAAGNGNNQVKLILVSHVAGYKLILHKIEN